ncbi:MAG: hypothetical protein QG646_1192 [Euryarchaeota archaeon]|nr:hypothetical protein [Euryarchaeota archaeon]
MGRHLTDEIIDEPGEPMVVKSKMGEASVSELEVRGIDNLSKMEKKHLLLQLARDRVKNSSAGSWEITDVRREEWRTIGTTIAQPVEIDIRDIGRNALFEVLIDITQFERELEAKEIETEYLEGEKRQSAKKKKS